MAEVQVFSGFRRERIGVVAGLPMGTLLGVLVLALPGILSFSQQRYLAGGVWLLIWVLMTCLIAVPIRGRSAMTWLWQWLLWLVGHALGWSQWMSRASEGDVDNREVNDLDLPGALQYVETVDGPPLPSIGLRQPCLLHDKRDGGSWRMVARVEHPGISMSSGERLNGQAQGLGDMMASLATSGIVRRLSIYARTEPGDDVERQAWLVGHLDSRVPEEMRHSALSLEAQVRATSISSDLFVCIEVGEGRIRREARAAGGGVLGRARVLYRHLGEVHQGLVGAGCTSVMWLTTPELVEAIRTGFEPSVGPRQSWGRQAGRGASRRCETSSHGLVSLPGLMRVWMLVWRRLRLVLLVRRVTGRSIGTAIS